MEANSTLMILGSIIFSVYTEPPDLYLFKKYLLRTFYVSGTIPGSLAISVNKKDKILSLKKLIVSVGK